MTSKARGAIPEVDEDWRPATRSRSTYIRAPQPPRTSQPQSGGWAKVERKTAASGVVENALRRSEAPPEAFAATLRLPIVVVLYERSRPYYRRDPCLCDATPSSGPSLTEPLSTSRALPCAGRAGLAALGPVGAARSALEAVLEARRDWRQIVIVELTSNRRPARGFRSEISAGVVLGAEFDGVWQEVADAADAAIAIPMRGMANSISVATAAAIARYRLARQAEALAAPLSAPQ